MTRSKRLEVVGEVLQDREDDRAKQLRAAEAAAQAEEQRLTELIGYRDDYQQSLVAKQRSGMSAPLLRDFQAFLAKLEQAIAQQRERVANARRARDGDHQSWREAATKSAAVDALVTRCRTEERKQEDQREQRASDERALRAYRDQQERGS